MRVHRNKMARIYTKTKLAEREAETRQRIVEAAVELHGEVGPAQTTVSMIAERAGVQRHTVYAHFADDRELLMACSGLHAGREPLPSPDAWSSIEDPSTRLRAALTALYGWFARNEAMTANVLRDAERSALVREVSGLRFGTGFAAIGASVASGLAPNGRAALALALSFFTWRTLVREAGLEPNAAVELMVSTIRGSFLAGESTAGVD